MKAFVCAIILASCLITGITLISIWNETVDPSISDSQGSGQLSGLA
ncbi:hypothetical protein [Labrys miyagiensis]|nr:hypothetical protein [Labrys miyagiensis]